MVYQVRLTRPAEADAYAAYEYIRQEAPRSGDKWLLNLFTVIKSLDTMPARCPVIPEAKELGHEARHLIYGKRSAAFRIIFDIQDQSDDGPRVRILRIWRGSRRPLTVNDVEPE